ncbi:MAG: DNA internalization-related competence protein ComEC/Rec2 [Firmicutes bacterium]|nr:DNA internalization-related competence protein ComEC/Rec2 [Bacillota bacterium]
MQQTLMTLRRPLTITALSFAGGICAAGLLTVPSHAFPLLAGVSAAAVLLFLCLFICKNYSQMDKRGILRQKIRQAVFLSAVFFLCGMSLCALGLSRESQLAPCEGRRVSISGTVLDATLKDGDKAVFTVRLAAGEALSCGGTSWKQKREKILVRVYQYEGNDPRLLTGHRVSLKGTVVLPQSASVPGGFDYKRYLLSEKIRAWVTAEQSALTPGRLEDPLRYRMAAFKVYYEQRLLETLTPDASALLCGIMFGDKTYMSDELTETFRENGTGHLLAASGLHVGFVYAVLNRLFRRPRTLPGNLPVIAVLVLYAALCAFSSSVVRSVFMITVLIVSRTSVRRYDFLTSISFCALVLLIYEPASLFSAGFLLSFMAVSSLAVILPATERIFSVEKQDEREMLARDLRRYRMKKYLASTTAVTLAIQAGMTPVTLENFHYISPAGLLINTPAIALAGLIVPSGLLLLPPSAAPAVLYGPAAMTAEMLVSLLIRLNRFADASGLSCIYLPSPPTGILLFFFFLLFFSCSETGQRIFRSARSHLSPSSVIVCLLLFAAAASICAGAGYACDMEYLQSDVIFVDVGQGDCAHLKSGSQNLIFDSGGSATRDIGKEVLMPYFLGNGVGSIDLAVISHLHTDHYEGLKSLSRYVRIRKLLVSAAYRSKQEEIEKDLGISGQDILYAVRGDRFRIGDTVIEVLAPENRPEKEFALLADDEEAENDCSMVNRVTYRNTSMLFTGDIDEKLEKELAEEQRDLLPCDVLKVAHHGSKYSSCSEFLEASAPSIAIIQVGKNLYGHPTPEALSRLKDCGASIYRNDRQGAVMLQFRKNGRIRVKTMKQAPLAD